jgi:hypothetical protein
MHSAFLVSLVLGLVAAGFSVIRGKEDRRQSVREAVGGE